MPKKIIKKFQKQYGKERGESIFYATANAQNRDMETFKKKRSKKKRITRKKKRG